MIMQVAGVKSDWTRNRTLPPMRADVAHRKFIIYRSYFRLGCGIRPTIISRAWEGNSAGVNFYLRPLSGHMFHSCLQRNVIAGNRRKNLHRFGWHRWARLTYSRVYLIHSCTAIYFEHGAFLVHFRVFACLVARTKQKQRNVYQS